MKFPVANLELAQFKLNHILVRGQNKDSWEELCVRLHLKEDSAVNNQHFMRTSIHAKPNSSNLVKCVYLFSISSESHESGVQINETANHKILLTDPGLLRAAKLASPNHVAVTALYTEEDR